MHYVMPTWQKLETLSRSLPLAYKGNNAQHMAYIKFYQSIIELILINQKKLYSPDSDEVKERKIACGALFFILFRIENEEDRASNSTLFGLIKVNMNLLTENPYTEIDRFILLVDVYNFIKNVRDESMLDEDEWLKSVLFETVSQKILIDVILTITNKMKYLFKLPRYLELYQQLDNLHVQYEKNKNVRMLGYNKERDKQVAIIMKIRQDVSNTLFNESNDDPDVLQARYMCLLGVVFYIAIQIQKTYPVGNADNSELYGLCKQVLKVEHLTDIPDVVKLKWLEALKKYVQNAYVLHDTAQMTKNSDSDNTLTSIQAIIDNIVKIISLNQKSTVSQVADFAKTTSMTAIAETVVAKTSSSIGFAVDAGAGLFGYAFLGPLGGLAATQVSRLTREKLMRELLEYGFLYLYISLILLIQLTFPY